MLYYSKSKGKEFLKNSLACIIDAEDKRQPAWRLPAGRQGRQAVTR
jgi:hypothetical protein